MELLHGIVENENEAIKWAFFVLNLLKKNKQKNSLFRLTPFCLVQGTSNSSS